MNRSGRKHDCDIGHMEIFLTSISTETSLGSILTETYPRSELS